MFVNIIRQSYNYMHTYLIFYSTKGKVWRFQFPWQYPCLILYFNCPLKTLKKTLLLTLPFSHFDNRNWNFCFFKEYFVVCDCLWVFFHNFSHCLLFLLFDTKNKSPVRLFHVWRKTSCTCESYFLMDDIETD